MLKEIKKQAEKVVKDMDFDMLDVNDYYSIVQSYYDLILAKKLENYITFVTYITKYIEITHKETVLDLIDIFACVDFS